MLFFQSLEKCLKFKQLLKLQKQTTLITPKCQLIHNAYILEVMWNINVSLPLLYQNLHSRKAAF